jgi:hypothetical protein
MILFYSQSINVVENPHFKELLCLLGIGNIEFKDLPGRTQITKAIFEAYHREYHLLVEELKV